MKTNTTTLLLASLGLLFTGVASADDTLDRTALPIPEPKTVNGIKQRPMDGVSMLYAAEDAKAKDRRTTQYFEMFGNRGLHHEGWVACTRCSLPWLMVQAWALPASSHSRLASPCGRQSFFTRQ